MLRRSLVSLFDGPAPIYHRKAMGIGKNARWRGNYGAYGRWHSQQGMIEEVTAKKSVTEIDREMMRYVHQHRIRHNQLFESYHRVTNATRRKKGAVQEFRIRRTRYLQKAFIAYTQFETMKTLKEQATLVSKYGQAAVNDAVGMPRDTEQRNQRMGLIRRAMRAPVTLNQAPVHVVTRKQHIPERFDRIYRLF